MLDGIHCISQKGKEFLKDTVFQMETGKTKKKFTKFHTHLGLSYTLATDSKKNKIKIIIRMFSARMWHCFHIFYGCYSIILFENKNTQPWSLSLTQSYDILLLNKWNIPMQNNDCGANVLYNAMHALCSADYTYSYDIVCSGYIPLSGKLHFFIMLIKKFLLGCWLKSNIDINTNECCH